MPSSPTRPKRCTKCKKIINSTNKSGLCSSCGTRAWGAEQKLKKCYICQEPCSGNLLIEHRKGSKVSFCPFHFNLLNSINKLKELRKRIKYLKSYH